MANKKGKKSNGNCLKNIEMEKYENLSKSVATDFLQQTYENGIST